MGRFIEEAINELNPLHDFDDIKFHNHLNKCSLSEIAEAQLRNLTFLLTLVKPLARGGVIGGTLGAVGSYLTGNPPSEGFVYGVVFGVCLDFNQYMSRGLYYYFREQLNPSD